MVLDSMDDDSDSKESDFMSFGGDDLDVYLNHYRIPKIVNYGPSGSSNPPKGRSNREQIKCNNEGKIMSLLELAAQKIACHLTFGQVEHIAYQLNLEKKKKDPQAKEADAPVPEHLQCKIAFWSFPQDEEDVRLYTCLANGNADVFIQAEDLISLNCVCDMLQVGFHLSANVKYIQESTNDLDYFKVAITFDRRRITSCSCSCSATTFWCQHAVAVCLQRIRKPHEITLRAPVSESLGRLRKRQLRKFAQYLINELPQQVLPAAQKLLDELLSGDKSFINQNEAAPDPTAGATINEQTSWCLDDTHLSIDIRKILLKQCTAQPTVCSDIQALHNTAPPAATEYSQLLRPIRGREPEGLWNLISILGEMTKRRDSNSLLLLDIMTQEVLRCDKIVTWWFETKVSLHSGSTIHYATTKNNSQCTSQYSCSNFCDEIVHLWRLAALNPSACASEKKRLYRKFFEWHLEILKRHSKLPETGTGNGAIKLVSKRNFLELFPGFKPALEGCLINWSDWDEKKGKLITATEDAEVEKTKSSKNKKRKKKSKAAKLSSGSELKQSPTNEDKENKIEQDVQLEANATKIAERSTNEEEAEPRETIATFELEKPTISGKSSSSHSPDDKIHDNKNPENTGNVERSSYAEGTDGIIAKEQQQAPCSLIEQGVSNNIQPPDQDEVNNEHAIIPEVEPDLQVYFMDRREESPLKAPEPESPEDYIKVNARRLNDPLEILYAKAEGLHAHGHLEEARKSALKAANEILNYPNYPSYKQLYTLTKRRKKKGSLDNQMSIVASEALTKIAFLCNVLLDDVTNHHLVFRLVLFGVEMKRSPAATKPLEVKLINQKHDLIMLLKNIVLHEGELAILREKAQALRDGIYESGQDALTTLILGNYIFEALVLSKSSNCNSSTRATLENARSGSTSSYTQSAQYQLDEHYILQGDINQQQNSQVQNDQLRQASSSLTVYGKLPFDANLGFNAALSAISVKVNFIEVEHPLLCEGTRRQRGELVLSLLTYYKDDQEKLDTILKHLLDKDVVLSSNLSDQQPLSAATSALSQEKSNPAVSGKKNNSSQDPNQPTEASAHFMFELAKTVFDKAGGNSSTAHLFRPQLINQNGGRGIHRRLHMCTLRIALYALGLQNRTSTNWMQRTYNGRASFIHEQALEIGLPAIKFLAENWEGYLTPVEVASIADKAGCSNDSELKRFAAELAKSCLRFANNLDFNAVRRILAQCKEQSIEMIEEACIEIEQVAEMDSVCADVLFATARAWFSLYEKLVMDETSSNHELTSGFYGQPQMKDSTFPLEQDIGASEWLVTSQPHQEKCQVPFNESVHPIPWDVYGRVDFPTISTLYTPTYKHVEYVKAAYRVGIKALDALKPSLHISSKHNPKKEEDVLWLLGLSKSLGRDCLHKFIWSAIKNITNPHVLHIISTDLTDFFANIPEDHVDRVHILLPLIDKCLDRFVKTTRDLMKHISYDQKNYVESILEVAQNLTATANTITAANHFKELLRIVDYRKQKKYRLYIETHERHKWVQELLKYITLCSCTKCRTGREITVKFLTC